MPSSSDPLKPLVEQIRFVGRTTGLFKTLPGFRKTHHTVPDAITPAAQNFLARVSADDLTSEAERWFQQAREVFAYKRTQLSLDVSPPTATLTTSDFSLELNYAFSEGDPSTYVLVRTLAGFRSGDFIRTPESERYFAGRFTDLAFTLRGGASVEAVIDAVESLERGEDDALQVDYPSDCSTCVLTVSGVEAEVRFDGAELVMIFPRVGTPSELIDGFLAVRHAFALTKNKALAGLFR